jgi:CHAT domain-containing protein/tetratricopeptide (TPR) repeat protein
MVPAVAILAAAAAVAPLQDAVELRLGETLQVEQRADETRTFRITLEAGKAYLLEAEQRELDLIIEITGPDGVSRTFDAPLLRFEPERLLIEAGTNGSHLVSLSSRQSRGGIARYSLQTRIWLQSNAMSQRAHDALIAETRAAQANAKGGTEAWPRVVDAYRQAASIWASLHEPAFEARARLAMAWLLYLQLSDWEEATREIKAVAGLYKKLGNESLYASALHVHGAIAIEAATEIGNPTGGMQASAEAEALFDEALARLEQAERIKVELGEAYERARIVNDIGLANFNRGNWAGARHHFGTAASMLAEIQEWTQELLARQNTATVDHERGDLVQALASYDRVLELLGPGDKLAASRGNLMDNMGAAQRALGQIDRALTSFTRALAEHERTGSQSGRGRSLSGIGVTYFSTGELELAREYLERALSIRKEARDGAGQVSTLLYLGSVYLQQGDVDRAIQAHRVAGKLAVTAGQRARAQVALGRGLAAANRIEEALQVLASARSTAEEAGTPVVVADALAERGRLLTASGRSSEASIELRRALNQYRELGLVTGEIDAMYELARSERVSGDLLSAYEYAAASIQRTEDLRTVIASPALRATYLASQREHFALAVDIAMSLALKSGGTDRLAWIAQALTITERARTRAMLDLLHEAAVGVNQTADPQLAQRRTELYQALAGLRFRQDRLLERHRKPEDLAELRTSLSRIETELQVVESEMRRRDPRHAALTAPTTLDAEEIQASLDEDTMLLQYQLGENRSWLFVVSTDAISAHSLPPRAEIEAIVLQAFELLRVMDPHLAARKARDRSLTQLSRMLVNPAVPLKPQLVISADGALHLLPFAALPSTTSNHAQQSLIAQHEVVSVPSISVVASQRQLRAERNRPTRILAIFADPVLQNDDPRFGASPIVPVDDELAPALLRSTQWSSKALRRLPATAGEADAIAELVSSNERLVAKGFEAKKSSVLGAELSNFRIVHFATHALVDDRYPALSALALSRFAADRTPLDAFLRLHDVYNLELSADLVTLSACETALGKELRGEGLIGLTRGFLFAGGSSVVASLWQVPDRTTAELMRKFYEAQFKNGLSPPAALRQAQLSVASERAWRDPYNWAAFVVHGEWRQSVGRSQTLNRGEVLDRDQVRLVQTRATVDDRYDLAENTE